MAEDAKAKVQTQFGSAADAYAVSTIHAAGESLSLLRTRTHPHPTWEVLDVGTGAGHTALRFAPWVKRVVAIDITDAMLRKAAELAFQRDTLNIEMSIADAEDLPFDDGAFDLVTCRLAMHHFAHPRRALREFVRVLKTPGTLGFADNVTVEDPDAAEYYNVFERLRDPSHAMVFSMTQLCELVEDAGLRIRWMHEFEKAIEFHDWADRQHVSTRDKMRLLQMMRRVPPVLQPLFQPRWTKTLHFRLREAVVIAETM